VNIVNKKDIHCIYTGWAKLNRATFQFLLVTIRRSKTSNLFGIDIESIYKY